VRLLVVPPSPRSHLFPYTTLFRSKALSENQWVVENGILRSPKSGDNLVTEEKFWNFELHVEFRYPKGSNSGVYLRGPYEVQIMRSEEHTSELQSRENLVCRLLLET